jgi:5-methylcytosine-specific restriction endonuclease McrA
LKSAQRRHRLDAQQRELILAKTGGNCHLCGGPAGKNWEADHVVPHMRGGSTDLSNLLPSCQECNGLRSAKSAEGIRKRFRLGVYAWPQVKAKTGLGRKLRALLDKKIAANEQKRKKRLAAGEQ